MFTELFDYDGIIAATSKVKAGGALNSTEQRLYEQGQRMLKMVRSNKPLAVLDEIAQQAVQRKGVKSDGKELAEVLDNSVKSSPLSEVSWSLLQRLLNRS